MARASAPTSNRSWCRPCSPATSSLPTISGPTRSPASNAPSRPPGPPSGTCHPTARTSIPSSSASRSSRPSFAPLAVAAPRRSGRSSASAWRTSALTNAATIFGTAGTRPPHGHEKRFSRLLKNTRIGLFSWPSCVSRPPDNGAHGDTLSRRGGQRHPRPAIRDTSPPDSATGPSYRRWRRR